jgi:hypothetical protein
MNDCKRSRGKKFEGRLACVEFPVDLVGLCANGPKVEILIGFTGLNRIRVKKIDRIPLILSFRL